MSRSRLSLLVALPVGAVAILSGCAVDPGGSGGGSTGGAAAGSGSVVVACTPQEEAEFAQTIRAYFAWDGDIQTCAEHLFIHRNTFQYRMDRIKRKTGYNLKAPKDALLLYLTL